jgi:hypothetical protein
MRIKYVCLHCGGDNVTRDAWAAWDADKGDWILSNVFDYAFCQDCEAETTLDTEPVIEAESE